MEGLLLGSVSPWITGPIACAIGSVGLIVVMRICYSRSKREDLLFLKQNPAS